MAVLEEDEHTVDDEEQDEGVLDGEENVKVALHFVFDQQQQPETHERTVLRKINQRTFI